MKNNTNGMIVDNKMSRNVVFSILIFIFLVAGIVYFIIIYPNPSDQSSNQPTPSLTVQSSQQAGIPDAKYKLDIPSSVRSVSINIDQLPNELKSLILDKKAKPTIEKVDYQDGRFGYNIKYDYILTPDDIKNFGQQHPELHASKITTQDVIGVNSIIIISESGWKILSNYRTDYTSFIDAEGAYGQVRFTQAYKDEYTAEIIIKSVSK